jgi:hypothetical protein
VFTLHSKGISLLPSLWKLRKKQYQVVQFNTVKDLLIKQQCEKAAQNWVSDHTNVVNPMKKTVQTKPSN